MSRLKYLLEEPDYGRKVQVYRNLHKMCWSVRCAKTRRVLYHTDNIILRDCKLFVSKKGQARVMKTRRKSVHAYVEGTWTNLPFNVTHLIDYNPYYGPSFYTKGTMKNIEYADDVNMSLAGTVYARGVR